MLKNIFNQPYPGEQCVLEELLQPLIGDYTAHNEDILKSNPAMQKLAEQANILQIKRIADFELDDIPLNVFDITLSDNVRLKYSRVNIQKVVRSIMDYYSGAIMFFHTESNQGDWRISFVEKEDTQKSGTSAKRYTFLVGENQSVKTVTQRFEILKNTPEKSVKAIREAFSVEKLTKEFYNDLFKWYSWALSDEIGITFPNDIRTSDDDKEKLEEKIIRLITRILFVWFIKHNKLVPHELFKVDFLKEKLKDFDENSLKSGNFYNAILQNLFFATLNKPINERGFASLKNGRDIKTLYRYSEMFSISEEQILELFRPIPFLNGGLFECLDKEMKTDGVQYHLDGFSRNERRLANGNYSHRAFIPNCIFFGDNDKNEGLIPLLERYNFTIEENSTSEMQVALDPELLGNVFENLLGAFNEETKETARKQSGSFYTPREIVNFMVDESLKAYLNSQTKEEKNFIDVLFKDGNLSDEEASILKNKSLCEKYSERLKCVKILDPACGSGAFPMGILNRMLELLDKLDVEDKKTHHDLKLHLIEKCIYGVDLQSIAVQISKLRFFISLVLEQKDMDLSKPEENYGVWTLPNLETKFVAANTLIGVKKNNLNLFDLGKVEDIKNKLLEIRHEHFYAKNVNKKKVLREEDERYREELLKILEENGEASSENLKQFTQWNPYDQNTSSSFFDMEWMFGLEDGFDIVIGNPPYIQLQKEGGKLAEMCKNENFQTFAKTGDIYQLFYEKGFQILKPHGHLTFITSNKWMRAGYGEKSRAFFAKNTNPKILIDFGGVQVFDSATVDTNILLFAKENNTFSTKAMVMGKDIKKEQLKNLSDYFRQHHLISQFSNDESWVILSEIEQRIKDKIEKVGVPLKDWDINIYRGILTGFNEAFIINGSKRNEILANCQTENERQKTDELIRPILRGRDIKRYSYDFADLWLINTHNGVREKGITRIKIEDYPAVKAHLDLYYPQLEKRADKGDTPYNLRNCAYIEEFSKQKIVWKAVGRNLSFSILEEDRFLTAPASFITSNYNLYILGFLCSSYAKYFIYNNSDKTGAGDIMLNIQSLIKIPLPKLEKKEEIDSLITKILSNKKENKETKNIEKELDSLIYSIFQLDKNEISYIKNI